MKLSLRRLAFPLVSLALGLLPACQQKMAVQPSYRPDGASSFFPDGRENRPLPAGTIARGHLRTDLALFTGQLTRRERNWAMPAAVVGVGGHGPLGAGALVMAEADRHVDAFPSPMTHAVLEHGMNRYMIYCVVCHDPLGTGHGKIVERGFTPPPTYHQPRLREVAVGHIYDVITNGYGSMPEYRQQIPVRDRWAIVGYVRALQLSQHFPEAELTDAMRQAWQKQGPKVARKDAAP